MAENGCCRKIIRDVIQILVEKLSASGEESFFMSARSEETSLHLIGSQKGLAYMEGYIGVPKGFISFLKTEHPQPEGTRTTSENSVMNLTRPLSCQEVATTSSAPDIFREKESGEVTKIKKEADCLNVPKLVPAIASTSRRLFETGRDRINSTSVKTEEGSRQDTGNTPISDVGEIETEFHIAEVKGNVQNWDTAPQPTQLENDTNILNNVSSPRANSDQYNATVYSKESVKVRNTTGVNETMKNGTVSRTPAFLKNKVSSTDGTINITDSQSNSLPKMSSDVCSISSECSLEATNREPDETSTVTQFDNTSEKTTGSASTNQQTQGRQKSGVATADSKKSERKRKSKRQLESENAIFRTESIKRPTPSADNEPDM